MQSKIRKLFRMLFLSAVVSGAMALPVFAVDQAVSIPTTNSEVLVSSVFPDEYLPMGFHKDTTTYQETPVECAKFDMGDITLLYTMDSAGANGAFKMYNGVDPELSDYRNIEGGNGKYIIILKADESVAVPAGYTKATLQWNGQNLEAYMVVDAPVGDYDPSGPQPSDFFLLYAINSEGNTGWYQYDQVEGTYQRYLASAGGGSVSIPDSTDELGIEDLPIWVYIVVGALFILMTIFLIIMIVSLVKLKDYQSYEYIDEDEFYAENSQGAASGTTSDADRAKGSGKLTASQMAKASMSDDDDDMMDDEDDEDLFSSKKAKKEKKKDKKRKKEEEEAGSFDWAAMESAMKDNTDTRRPRGNDQSRMPEYYSGTDTPDSAKGGEPEKPEKPERPERPETSLTSPARPGSESAEDDAPRAPLKDEKPSAADGGVSEHELRNTVKGIKDESDKIRSSSDFNTKEIEFALAQERERTLAEAREAENIKERELESARKREEELNRKRAIEEARIKEENDRALMERQRAEEQARREEELKRIAREEQEEKIRELERKRDELLRQQEERNRRREAEAMNAGQYGQGYDTGALFSNPTAFQSDPYRSGQNAPYRQGQSDPYRGGGDNGRYQDPGYSAYQYGSSGYQNAGNSYSNPNPPQYGGGNASYGNPDPRYYDRGGAPDNPGAAYNQRYSNVQARYGYEQQGGYPGSLPPKSSPINPNTANLEMDDDFEFEFLNTGDDD